jgi:DNA ligase-1
MQYSELVNVYEALAGTSKRLEKTSILADFLKKLKKEDPKIIYLLAGRVVPDYDTRELGISEQLTIKAIAHSFGIKEEKVSERFKKIGDLGEIAQEFSEKRKQSGLFSSKLTVEKVFENLHKAMEIEGKGAVDRKMSFIAELLTNASGLEAKYLVRTLLSDLRIGIAAPTIVEAIASTFFEDKDEIVDEIQSAYDLSNDFALIFSAAEKGLKEIEKISLEPGRPINVMLAPKVTNIDEAFEICGRPAAIEEKYDGFRTLISKDKNGKIELFTRRLENVTAQFPDVVAAVAKQVRGNSFILDSEVVGYNPKTKKYTPFEAISQRIKRKYDIDKIIKELPVEIDVFDCLYHDGKSMINLPFKERRKMVERIVVEKELVIRPAVQIVTDDDEKAMGFYEHALKIGEEGIMMKKLDAPYKQGRRVGYMVKMKPEVNDLDLVIVGAEHGTGKRGGLLTSYIVACRNDKGELLEIGKVSSGLKEKEEEGFTFEQMTKLLNELKIEEKDGIVKVKPKIVVMVTYQNIQESPSYSSGYALRFPRITRYRPDRSVKDIDLLEDIKKEVKKGRK